MSRSLLQKLGFKPDWIVLLIGAPDGYGSLLGQADDLPTFVTDPPVSGPVDAVHLFATTRKELDATLPFCRGLIRPAGTIWVSWLKKASGRATEVGEDSIREVAFPLQLVDVKVCSVSADWSGLKLVVRREAR